MVEEGETLSKSSLRKNPEGVRQRPRLDATASETDASRSSDDASGREESRIRGSGRRTEEVRTEPERSGRSRRGRSCMVITQLLLPVGFVSTFLPVLLLLYTLRVGLDAGSISCHLNSTFLCFLFFMVFTIFGLCKPSGRWGT
ncbi:hypothetical protein K438DRAFT_1878307 [Mycena galopus ATCC 62051]|nr:hypothetical protein K438DRAFT_1878307 [Mycena galopus ATCC 62051]